MSNKKKKLGTAELQLNTVGSQERGNTRSIQHGRGRWRETQGRRVCLVEMEEMGREGPLEKQLQNGRSLTSAKRSQGPPPDGLNN